MCHQGASAPLAARAGCGAASVHAQEERRCVGGQVGLIHLSEKDEAIYGGDWKELDRSPERVDLSLESIDEIFSRRALFPPRIRRQKSANAVDGSSAQAGLISRRDMAKR